MHDKLVSDNVINKLLYIMLIIRYIEQWSKLDQVVFDF